MILSTFLPAAVVRRVVERYLPLVREVAGWYPPQQRDVFCPRASMANIKRTLKPRSEAKAAEDQLKEWMRVRKLLHFDMWTGMKVMSWVGSVIQMKGNAITFEESMQSFRCHFFLNLFARTEVTRDENSTTVALRGDARSDTIIISDVRRPVNIEDFTMLTKGVH